MKRIYILALAAVVAVTVFSCKKTKVTPLTSSKVDTSTTLIDDKILVGNWNIVSDTVSYMNNTVMYQGTPNDHYIFTKYGNLYINEGLDKLIDTAIYSVTPGNGTVAWINSYFSTNGVAYIGSTQSFTYNITSIDSVSMVLTSSQATQNGQRYEQIKFKKQ